MFNRSRRLTIYFKTRRSRLGCNILLGGVMAFPWCNQADILNAEPRLAYERRHWDGEGYERTERRNGAYQCPKCGLWWPVIEEPDCWTMNQRDENKWDAEGWWGGVVCEDCEILMVDQPDGRVECYDLSST